MRCLPLLRALHHALTYHSNLAWSQCTLAPVLLRGDKPVQLYVSHMPCGHCRQFLNEMSHGGELRIHVGGKSWTLDELLPVSFKPSDIAGGYCVGERAPLTRTAMALRAPPAAVDAPLLDAALHAAAAAHVPHTGHRSGVALRAGAGGVVVQGAYLENAAFNPSLPPLQSALAAFAGSYGRQSFETITDVVLADQEGLAVSVFDVVASTTQLLRAVAPHARLTVVTFTVA